MPIRRRPRTLRSLENDRWSAAVVDPSSGRLQAVDVGRHPPSRAAVPCEHQQVHSPGRGEGEPQGTVRAATKRGGGSIETGDLASVHGFTRVTEAAPAVRADLHEYERLGWTGFDRDEIDLIPIDTHVPGEHAPAACDQVRRCGCLRTATRHATRTRWSWHLVDPSGHGSRMTGSTSRVLIDHDSGPSSPPPDRVRPEPSVRPQGGPTLVDRSKASWSPSRMARMR